MFRTTASIENDKSSMVTNINIADIERRITRQNGNRHEIMIKNRMVDYINILWHHMKGLTLQDIFTQTSYEDIMFTIIHISLSFIFKLTVNQPVPAMFYKTYSKAIPYEYVVFTPASCNNQDVVVTELPKITCHVDRESILNLLQSKTAIHYREDDNDVLITTLYDDIACNVNTNDVSSDKINENEILQFFFLYIILEHSFVHLYIHVNENEKKNALSMIDHTVYFALGKGVSSKLLMSTFRYKIEQDNTVNKHIPIFKINNQ
ncbi:occlusion-derived virus envelope/capsid protein [Neodiprion lecontei nucleopolyhedrovirus]|uniref:Occlusion-derived virus envelope/capsid protein n=1 Tax=Neodiprion lecontei nucleopolyhedrovirus (strain Canada) TaxID=654906 RepID=Q6JPA5_NPVNC|nr:occlusion-derived virus envelope/capsid protein [Neodiprion lecontei nucleopolyhedrovirus]AAQ99092.1 occlusion-derived virus envelope/capsid protein [Neodiprion lecontei nucleopolyhedrovirus]